MVHFLCREKDYKMGNEEANMVSILLSVLGQRGVDALALLLAFVLTALLTNLFRSRLPPDHGRAFAGGHPLLSSLRWIGTRPDWPAKRPWRL